MFLIRKISIMLVALTVTASCGTAPTKFEIKYIDSRLLFYVQNFERALNRPLNRTDTITFGDTSDADDNDPNTSVVAYVQQRGSYYTMIVNQKYWDNASGDDRQALIYHELGHSECGLQHDETKTNGMPTSLMFPQMFSVPSEMLTHYYYPELIEKCTTIRFIQSEQVFEGLHKHE